MLSAIVVAAGRSNRFSRLNISKVLAKINSKPVIYYSLSVLNRHPDVNEIIVVANSGNIKAVAKVAARFKKNCDDLFQNRSSLFSIISEKFIFIYLIRMLKPL